MVMWQSGLMLRFPKPAGRAWKAAPVGSNPTVTVPFQSEGLLPWPGNRPSVAPNGGHGPCQEYPMWQAALRD